MIEHSLIKHSTKSAYRSFNSGIEDFMGVQESKLLSIIRKNENTEFGLKYDFKGIHSISDYVNVVPIGDYDSHEDFITCQYETGEKTLLDEKILLYEKSSGSSSPSKYIPYTGSLKSEFMNGVEPWLYDLYMNYPEIQKGKHYWSISPIIENEKYSPIKIPVGFEEDSGYFNKLQSILLSRVFAVPNEVKHLRAEDFATLTLYYLVLAEDLSFISIWNPSFLSVLLSELELYKRQLIRAFETGEMKLSNGEFMRFKSNNKTVSRAKILKGFSGHDYNELWPNLKLISCWEDGFSRKMAEDLKKLFPKTLFQGKGLLATEGIISFPLEGIGKVLSYKSHFFEFMDLKTGDIFLSDNLISGNTYSVLLTTSGGLYRYRLYDLIKVSGHYKGLPIIEFLGKEAHISDYYGEKINEIHVGELFKRLEVEGFAALAPFGINPMSYCVFMENAPLDLAGFKSKVDTILRENFHYDYARILGQIGDVKVFIITEDPWEAYYSKRSEKMKLGDIKFSPLYSEKGLEVAFKGHFI